ncbi:Polyadenylate-binding protein 2 [Hordeum vulgare]|nr:Polyadenylate-binding protein 2 [Hordeum vulgare]
MVVTAIDQSRMDSSGGGVGQVLVLRADAMSCISLLNNPLLCETVAGTRMGCKSDLTDQLQKDGMSVVTADYEEGSEEEEPFEREFYDDDDDDYEEGSEEEEPFEREFYDDEDGDDDDCEPKTQAVDSSEVSLADVSEEEPCDVAAPLEDEDASYEEPFVSELCYEEEDSCEQDSYYAGPHTDSYRKKLYEVEPCDDQVAHEYEFVKKKSSTVQTINKEQNKKVVLKRALRKGSSNELKAVPVIDDMETKPSKKRLSVRFATDVSCYTYSTESFGAAKLEKRKAQFDDQDSHLRKRQEHIVSSLKDGGKLKEVDETNLYVGNLPASVSSHKLIELFLPFGRIVRSKVADDRFTGISQGYGFVKYASARSAAAATERMNGRLIDGKALEVRVAGPPTSVSNPCKQSVSETCSLPSKEIDASNLYVSNLPLSMDTLKLLDHFLPFGKVTYIKVPRDHTTGLSKGYGHVKYADSRHAAQAIIHLNGLLVEGKRIEVRLSDISPTLSNSAVGSHTNSRTIKEIDMANLYVCNIPASINTNKLIDLFLPFGKITQARVAADQEGAHSGKGYGFVKFADSQCAAEAIALMNGALVEGETLNVRVAGLSSSASSSAVQGSPIKSPEINKSRLYITNLPQTMNDNKLIELFLPFGQISKVVINPEYSLVYYADVASAMTAAERMDGYLIGGKRLVVRGSEYCQPNAAEQALSQPAGKPTKEIDMANVYVGSIPPTVTCDQLVELFRSFGQIVQSRLFHGYGMVRYNHPSSATAAIDHMDGYQIGGSSLVVRVAGLPNPGDCLTVHAPVTGNEQRQIDMTNLYVCHLPLHVTTEKLIEIFLPCGQITQAKVVVDWHTGGSRGFGFVKFADAYGAAVALTHMNGCPLEGHILGVRIAGVHPSDMDSYMTRLYSQFTLPDPSMMAVGIPTSSYWPYYCAESAYVEGQGADTASQTSQEESVSASSFAEKGCSSVSSHVTDSSQQHSSAGWAAPPGFNPHTISSQPPSTGRAGPPSFNPHATAKKDSATARKPSQPCSKVHLAQSGGSQKRRSIV